MRVARVEQLPFPDGTFDLVTCLDVVEHTPDDRATLAELRRVTRPGGLLVVTVPAYQALWSWHDVVNLHFRRYDSASLRAAAREAGWDVVRDTHFNSLLLAPAAAVRLAQRRRHAHPRLRPRAHPARARRPARASAPARSWLVRAGLRLPAGLSLLAVLRRPALPAVPALRPAAALAAVPAEAVLPDAVAA